MKDILFLPVKPKWADLIMSGQKTLELRKRLPSRGYGNRCVIYASSPRCEVLGAVTLAAGLQDMSNMDTSKACVSRAEFEKYFETSTPRGLVLLHPTPFAKPIALEVLRSRWGIEPPQQWRHIDGKTFDEIVEAGR